MKSDVIYVQVSKYKVKLKSPVLRLTSSHILSSAWCLMIKTFTSYDVSRSEITSGIKTITTTVVVYRFSGNNMNDAFNNVTYIRKNAKMRF